MFLERKFSRRGPGGRAEPALCPTLPDADRSGLPEPVHDVLCNLQLLLSARRKYSHVFHDFGLSASNGEHGVEARIELIQEELPALLARYESRFRLSEIDVDVDDEGAPSVKVQGELTVAPGTLTFSFGVISRRISSFEYAPAQPG